MKNFAERLTWARKQKNLTQAALAKLVSISQSAIGNLSSPSRSANKTSRSLLPLAAALDVDPLWLAEGKGSPTRSPLLQAVPDSALLLLSATELDYLLTYRQASQQGRMVIDSAFAIAHNMASVARHQA